MDEKELLEKVKAIVVDLLGVDEAKVVPEARFREDLEAEPGPEIGRMLDQVRNSQDTEMVTTREEALSFVKAQLL